MSKKFTNVTHPYRIQFCTGASILNMLQVQPMSLDELP